MIKENNECIKELLINSMSVLTTLEWDKSGPSMSVLTTLEWDKSGSSVSCTLSPIKKTSRCLNWIDFIEPWFLYISILF